jgi:hypothetical protein
MGVLDSLKQEIDRAEAYIGKLHEHVITVVNDGGASDRDATVTAITANLAKNKSAVVDSAAIALKGAETHLAELEANVRKVTEENSAEKSKLQEQLENLRSDLVSAQTHITMYKQSHDAIDKLARSLTGLTAFGRDSAVAFGRVAPRFV